MLRSCCTGERSVSAASGSFSSYQGCFGSFDCPTGALCPCDGTLQECIRPSLGCVRASCNPPGPATDGLHALLRRARGFDRDDFLVRLAVTLQLGLLVALRCLSVAPLSRSVPLLCFLIAQVRLLIVREVKITLGSRTVTHGGFPVAASSFLIAAPRVLVEVLSAHRATQPPHVGSAVGTCSVPLGVSQSEVP